MRLKVELRASKEEWELVNVNIRRNIANFTSVNGYLISQHARSWDLNGIWPVIVTETEGIGKVEDSIFRDLGGVLSYIKMCRLNCTLSDIVRNKEEIKFSINNFRLLNESLVNISTLRRVYVFFSLINIEESLSYSLINNNKSNVWGLNLILMKTILISDYNFQLFKFIIDNLLSH